MKTTLEYLDLDIEIGAGVGGREFPVSARSHMGEAHESMHFPFDKLTLENRLQALQIALLRSGGQRRRIPSPEEKTVEQFGTELFDALFKGEVRDLYNVSQRSAVDQRKGLRLRIRVRDPELAALPWEFLYDTRQAGYVCLSRHTPLVRYLDLPQPSQPLVIEPPLRILGMMSSPADLEPLDVHREKQRIEEALKDLGDLVVLQWITGQTWRDLDEALDGGPWHIFHFIGHGGFNKHTDEGFIVLADDDGDPFLLSASQMGLLLHHHHTLRLVLLNACEGARGSKLDIFSSSAATLVRRGIPAVLAMQYEITDRAAIEFSRSFYRALARGNPIDDAVTKARVAISLAVNNTVEWGTPVLFLRSSDARIFDVKRLGDASPSQDYKQAVDALTKSLRLQAKAAEGRENWQEVITNLEKILAADPTDRETADQLVRAQERQKLENLYAKGQQLVEERKWSESLQVLAQANSIQTDYKDIGILITKARNELTQIEKEDRLKELHNAAREAEAREDWDVALERWQSILSIAPSHVEATAKVKEAYKQRELAATYIRALANYKSKRWREALQDLGLIHEQENNYKDVASLITATEGELKKEAEVERRQKEKAALNIEAKSAISNGSWDLAMEKLAAITKLDPTDKESRNKLKYVRRQSRRAKGEGYYKWLMVLRVYRLPILGLLLVTTAGVFVYMYTTRVTPSVDPPVNSPSQIASPDEHIQPTPLATPQNGNNDPLLTNTDSVICFDRKIQISPADKTIAPGDVVNFSTGGVTGVQKIGDVTYSWTSSAGTITGRDSSARLNTAGVAAGTTIKVALNAQDPSGKCSAAGTATLRIKAAVSEEADASPGPRPGTRCLRFGRPNQLSNTPAIRATGNGNTRCTSFEVSPGRFFINHTPEVSIRQTSNKVFSGETLEFSAGGSDRDGDSLLYSWSSTGGRIVGTGRKVTINTEGMQPGTYTVTVEVDDGCGCINFVSTQFSVVPRP